ncbi:DNA methyltransferase [Brevibacillus halotolerans]|uniref:DNA adenine methylase n=1 Tax=Brevibacillus halotolerans TaxID=1507437 RepID=UPI001B25DDF4|nr:DNA adenine methylase [Brevibacillus halotolerans]GIO02983.1 DNA methyltransferase [Brevibacillus halotolerans]
MARSPLIWFGGKGKVANHIISRMPFHTCYVELFGGVAHVIAQKAPITNEVYNDIDGEVVNFLLMARNKPKLLREACESLPYSRMLYEKWKREKPPADDFERAVRFFYVNRSGIAKGNSDSAFSTDTGWRHSKEHNTARTYQSACRIIESFAERMKTVMIDNRDFRDVAMVYDSPTTLFYVDPPYIGREKYYALTDDDRKHPEQLHRDLADIMNTIQGKAIISYYDDPLLDELYPNWRRETFKSARQVVNGSNNIAEELLLMNFDDGQMNIFDIG